MTPRDQLTAEKLRSILRYDPETGHFYRYKASSKTVAGAKAGFIHRFGYVVIRVDMTVYKAHRLAVLYMTGEWPKNEVDHINGIRHENQWSNLRDATRPENHQNLAGVGVQYCKQRKKWRARIKSLGKEHHIGRFDTREEAHAAYLRAKAKLHTFNPIPRDYK